MVEAGHEEGALGEAVEQQGVADQRFSDGAKGCTNRKTNGQINHIATQGERFKFIKDIFEHKYVLFDVRWLGAGRWEKKNVEQATATKCRCLIKRGIIYAAIAIGED